MGKLRGALVQKKYQPWFTQISDSKETYPHCRPWNSTRCVPFKTIGSLPCRLGQCNWPVLVILNLISESHLDQGSTSSKTRGAFLSRNWTNKIPGQLKPSLQSQANSKINITPFLILMRRSASRVCAPLDLALIKGTNIVKYVSKHLSIYIYIDFYFFILYI